MILIYVGLGLTLACLLGIWFITIKTEQILSSTPLKGYEYKELYSLVKREFNKGNYKTWTHNEVMDKCMSVNTEWNKNSRNTRCDVSIWAMIAACVYISNSHCRKAPVKKALRKYKRKYCLEYTLIKIMVGGK